MRLIGGLHKSKKPKCLSIKEFNKKRDTILIQRSTGGLGDVLMHRMIFEDFKLLCPEIKIHFACPPAYMASMQDHPFIDKVLDSTKTDPSDYVQYYDTTIICGKTEQINAPMSSPHRSDIWANWCGLSLTKHDMHFNFTEEEISFAKAMIANKKNKTGPNVAFCPCSAMKSKNLDEQQIRDTVDGLHELGCFVYGLHNRPVLGLETPILSGHDIRNYMALIAVADYVVSVDTAAFHIAGGLGKKQVGIFSWADGDVYGKYYKNCEIVQRHRKNGDWDCGPCYNWGLCPKEKNSVRKPCITEITGAEIVDKFKSFYR